MDPFDPLTNSLAVSGWKPLLTLALLGSIGAFFFGALITAVLQGRKEHVKSDHKEKDK